MKKPDLLLMYFCAAVTASVIYSPQSIVNVFESELNISKQEAGLFITALMVPLAFAGVIYGYLLEKITIRVMLGTGFALLGFAQITFALSNSYALMLNIRGFQGLIIPVALTGIMSYISQTSSRDSVASAIGAYIGMTILGGFLGRFLSGVCTDLFGWRFFLMIIGVLCLICASLIYLKCKNITAGFLKPKLKDIILVLKEKQNLFIYLMIFCLFFAFQAILNYIPFELSSVLDKPSATKTGILYAAYLVGALISFNVKRIATFFGGAINSILVGIFIAFLSMICFTIQNFWGLFGAMFVLCIGNFIAHSTATAFVNKEATCHKGIANGLYVSFYYLGGSLGSFLPGFVYLNFGWKVFLMLLGAFCILAFSFILRLKYVR